MKKDIRALSTSAIASALMILAAPAWAQSEAGAPDTADADAGIGAAIVVTAQKREQNIQDIGIAVTAFGGGQLAKLGIADSDTLQSVVPSLQITNFGSQGISIFSIRGVSQNDFSDQNEAPVAMYVDGAYRSFIGAAGFSMFDVERVEVLRGPQGTLFGRNATGGLVHVINSKPTRTFEALGEVQGGENGLIESNGALSGALSKDFLARLSVSTKHNDGYIRNTFGGKQGGANNYAARLQLELAPEDSRSSLLLSIHYSRDNVKRATVYDSKRAIIDYSDPAKRTIRPSSDAAYASFCGTTFDANSPAPLIVTGASNCAGWTDPDPSNPYVTQLDNPGISKREVYGATLTANVAISDSVDLVAISDYLKLKRRLSLDTDGTGFRMFNFNSRANSAQMSQEVRLQGSSGPVHWVAGLYYLAIDHDINTGIDALTDAYTLANANPDVLFPFLTDNAVRQHTESYAVFGQAEWKLSPSVSMILGGRWNHDSLRIDMRTSCINGFLPFACSVVAQPGSVQAQGFTDANSGGLNRQSYGDWSGKAELDYRPVAGILAYASVTRGQKGGGFNAPAIAGITAAVMPYKPEILTSYEGGLKTSLFGNSTRLNISAFYYDYANYQAYTLTGLAPTIFNTSATVKGVEAEVNTTPLPGVTIGGSVTYLDAIAHDVPSNLLGTGVNLGDQHMPQSPRWSGTGLLRYEFDLGGGRVGLQGDARYTSKRYFNTVNHPALTDGSNFVANGRISYTTANRVWEFAVWGKNLTKQVVYASGFDLAGTNGTTPLVLGPPRWFGGSVSFRYR
ncbi:MAG: TonB-dependent receptor [Sphingobium sp.]